jgi:hypothetical protein
LDLKYKVESSAFVVKSHEATVQGQVKEIGMLRHSLSEHENMIFKFNMKGMYDFCVCL